MVGESLKSGVREQHGGDEVPDTVEGGGVIENLPAAVDTALEVGEHLVAYANATLGVVLRFDEIERDDLRALEGELSSVLECDGEDDGGVEVWSVRHARDADGLGHEAGIDRVLARVVRIGHRGGGLGRSVAL